jgi:iron-sulfur cluster insertion protein
MKEENFNFIITDIAATKVDQLIKEEKAECKYLRISVDGGGCSGFMYKYELTDKLMSDDKVIEHFKAHILIDPISQEFLNGSKLDYIQELGAEFFQISNPKAKYKCGCGNSFNV